MNETRTRVAATNVVVGEPEAFTEVPPRIRRGGGGGRSSPVLDNLRALPANSSMTLTRSHPDGYQKAARNVASYLASAKLPFKYTYRTVSNDGINSVTVRIFNLGPVDEEVAETPAQEG